MFRKDRRIAQRQYYLKYYNVHESAMKKNTSMIIQFNCQSEYLEETDELLEDYSILNCFQSFIQVPTTTAI